MHCFNNIIGKGMQFTKIFDTPVKICSILGLPVAVFGDESRIRLNEESWEMRLTIPSLSLDSLGK